ncbi:MAG: hypothetical protein M1158_02110 [Candidatus Marsarchaeota archaeon]|nr:hypothetical protein [Candidatus Marsarchaeota archaeon]
MERSVVAAVIFSKLSTKNTATSSGFHVKAENGVGKGPSEITSPLLNKAGYDASNHHRIQLTKRMFDDADIVIFIVNRMEKRMLPSYCKSSKKTIFWDINASIHTAEHHAARLRIIEHLVMELVIETG